MEFEQIKELMEAMEKMGMRRLRIKNKSGDEIELEKENEPRPSPQDAVSYPHYESVGCSLTSLNSVTPSSGEGKFITAPLVGTLYYAISPDDLPLVKIGDVINENSVVCIIEAMKVMNEVRAGVSGTVVEVLVQNAHPVEFGTKLFKIA